LTVVNDPSFLRDRLAVQRTVLANERTLLAYVRTAIALLAAGVTGIHVFDAALLEVTGWALAAVGAATVIFGVTRFLRIRALLRGGPQATPDSSAP
jgi:putative membrane protein